MLSIAALAATLALSPAAGARIDGIVRTVMREQHLPGLSLGVARGGRVLYLHGYGYRDVRTKARADAYTIYRIGSITKQFTAALILGEAQRQAIDLDAPIGTYVRDLPPAAAGVPVNDLLAQTSGIADFTNGNQTPAYPSVLSAPLAFVPGSVWQYSNTNYLLLGDALAKVAQMPYADLVERSILSPLHLVSTSIALPAAQNVASGYRWGDGGFVPVPPSAEDAPQFLMGAAAMSSNVPDLLRWLDALRLGRVAGVEGFRRMTTSQRLTSGERTGYGYGFFVQDWYGLRTAYHPGILDGFTGADAIVLDDALEVAVLTNADRADILPLVKSIVAVVDGPKDANLYASRPRAPENENPNVTRLVQTVFMQLQRGTIDRTLLAPSFSAALTDADLRADRLLVAGCGSLALTEFIERTHGESLSFEKYRLTCGSERLWMTLGVTDDDRIGSLQILKDED
jgi:CubicO group peptidase (beta-lactamase class C family)